MMWFPGYVMSRCYDVLTMWCRNIQTMWRHYTDIFSKIMPWPHYADSLVELPYYVRATGSSCWTLGDISAEDSNHLSPFPSLKMKKPMMPKKHFWCCLRPVDVFSPSLLRNTGSILFDSEDRPRECRVSSLVTNEADEADKMSFEDQPSSVVKWKLSLFCSYLDFQTMFLSLKVGPSRDPGAGYRGAGMWTQVS